MVIYILYTVFAELDSGPEFLWVSEGVSASVISIIFHVGIYTISIIYILFSIRLYYIIMYLMY